MTAKLSFAVSAGLVALAAAQEVVPDLEMKERIFLTSSHPEAGIINYLEMYEHHDKPEHLQKLGSDWRPLITGLKYPTHTAYDFKNKWFYVCDCDEVLQFQVNFTETNGEDIIYTIRKGAIAQGVECGGLSIDKFSNLFFVDKSRSAIQKVNRDLLKLEKYPVDVISTVYEGAGSRAAQNVQDIDIEHEYLYWANDSHSDGHGGVHKAFTEPFIKAEPFQTYEIKDVKRASQITTNENFLFFIGESATAIDAWPELFVQKKQGAGLYYHFSEDLTDRLAYPKSLLTYKDTLLLVGNEGFISMLDMTKFPPLPTDFQEQEIAITQQPSTFPSNSICASQRIAEASSNQRRVPEKLTPHSMSFISMKSRTVNAKTQSFSGAISQGLAAIGVATGVLLLSAF